MLLKEFLDKNGIRYKWFAKQLGISPSYFSEIVNLKKVPKNPDLAKKIEQLTNGQVSRLEVLYPEEYLKTTGSLPVNYQYPTSSLSIGEIGKSRK